ncbi:MAG: threonine synthase [Acidobacteria bacterium]|nr:threonine synthase [Acidobacteriota bacterium]
MQYFSTNRKSPHASFREATLNGQPDDRGLYFPERIPKLSDDFWSRFGAMDKASVAFEVIRPFVAGEIADERLFEICSETVSFDFPLVRIDERISTLELFHGATHAFKDVGARFMSRCLREFSGQTTGKTVVVVATSGDTGGAVANGFYGVDGVEVVILFPKGKVSRVQELQLTTLGQNIHAFEVTGDFDACQKLAKTALADADLKREVFLTSANSINVARWLPQQFYYFYAHRQWLESGRTEPPVISVPSGNFGNICAGILAHISGLPAAKFIAACNANDVVPRFLETGEMIEKTAAATLSNAMDVANPSNFVRILEMFDRDYVRLKDLLVSVSVSDDQTRATMLDVYKRFGYVLDPHGAVGFRALEDYLEANPGAGYFLETAHPVKFDSVLEITGTFGTIPDSVAELESRPKKSTEIGVDYEDLKSILRNLI